MPTLTVQPRPAAPHHNWEFELLEDTGQELFLRFEERDAIAKVAHRTASGLDVELHHILTFT